MKHSCQETNSEYVSSSIIITEKCNRLKGEIRREGHILIAKILFNLCLGRGKQYCQELVIIDNLFSAVKSKAPVGCLSLSVWYLQDLRSLC